jgi:hypothetical protein
MFNAEVSINTRSWHQYATFLPSLTYVAKKRKINFVSVHEFVLYLKHDEKMLKGKRKRLEMSNFVKTTFVRTNNFFGHVLPKSEHYIKHVLMASTYHNHIFAIIDMCCKKEKNINFVFARVRTFI